MRKTASLPYNSTKKVLLLEITIILQNVQVSYEYLPHRQIE